MTKEDMQEVGVEEDEVFDTGVWRVSYWGPSWKRRILPQLKGHCIEFRYYADGIHSGLTPPT